MQTSNQRVNVSKVKKIIIKKLSFLPYVDYVPDVKPKEPGLILLGELQRYENIVDDHVKFELAEEKRNRMNIVNLQKHQQQYKEVNTNDTNI